jgi:hypothetical protein
MPAYAWSWIKDLHTRVTVGNLNRFPNIHSKPVCQAGELVGYRDIDIAIRIFHQLDHLRSG